MISSKLLKYDLKPLGTIVVRFRGIGGIYASYV